MVADMLPVVGDIKGGFDAVGLFRGGHPLAGALALASMLPGVPNVAKALQDITKAHPKIRAFHGSPHDFDKFSLEKIGTGEGAQAYGYGLYFTDKKDIAEFYRNQLTGTTPGAPSGRAKYSVSGAEFPQGRSGHDALDVAGDIEMYLGVLRSSPNSDMIPFLRGKIDTRIGSWRASGTNTGSAGEDMAAISDFWEKHASKATPESVVENRGRTYAVDIDVDDADLLDWDKPLSQQGEKVRAALREVSGGKAKLWMTGSDLYRGLAETRPVETILPKLGGDQAVSEALRQRGVKGIRYLAGDSRAAGKGNSNYVIFDDKLVSIAEKMGLFGGAVGASYMIRRNQQRKQGT
jgi:hypothetical protein